MNLRLLKQLLDNTLSSVSDEASSVANHIANNVDSYDTPSIRGLLGTKEGNIVQEPLEKSRLVDILQQGRSKPFPYQVNVEDDKLKLYSPDRELISTQEPLTTTRTRIRQALRNSLISNSSTTVTENDGTEAMVMGNPIAIRTGTDVKSNTQGDMRQTVTQVDRDKLSKNLPQIVIHDYKINRQGERYTIPITINNPDGTVNDSFTRRLSSMASGGEKEGYITTVNKDEIENLLVREQYGISVDDDNRYNPQTMWLVGEENVVKWKNGVPETEFLDEARTIPKKRIVVRQAITTGRVIPVSETFSSKPPRNIESELVTTDEGDKYVSSKAGQWASSISTQKREASILPNNVDDTVGQKILQSTIGDKTERYVIPYKTTGIKYYIDADKLKEEGFDPVTMGQQIAPTSDKIGADGTMGSTRPELFGTRGLVDRDRLSDLKTNETRTQTIYGVERTTILQELLDKGDEDAILKYLNPRYLNRQEVINNNNLSEPVTTTKKPSELGLERGVPYTTSTDIDDSTLSQVLSQFYTQRMDSTVRQQLFNDNANEMIPETIPVKTLAEFNETSLSVIQNNGMDLSTINPIAIGTTTVTKRDVSDSTDVSAFKNLSAIGGEYEAPVRTMIRKMHIDWISPTDVIENSKNPVTNQYAMSQSDIENMILEQGKYFSSTRRSSDKASKYKKALNDEYINLGVLENKIQSLQYMPNGELQIVELARANGIGVRDGDTIPVIQTYIKQRKGDVANKIDILSTTPFDKLDVSDDTHKKILKDAMGYSDVEWSVEHTHNGSMLADFYDYHSELQRLQQQGNQIESNEKISFLQGKLNELLPKISIATSPINTAVVNPLNNSKVVNDRITGTTPNHKFRNENNQKLADLANGYFGKSIFPHFDNNGSVIPSHTKTYEDRWHYYIDDTTEAGNYGGYLNDNLTGDKLNQDRIIHISGDSNFHKGNIEFTYNGQATTLTEDVLNQHFDNTYATKLDEFARANTQIVLDNTDGINSRVRKYLVEKHGYQEIPLTDKSSKGKEYLYGYQLIHPSNPNFNIAPANQTPYQSKLAYNNKEVWIDKPLSTSKMTVKGKEINPLGKRLLLSSQDFSRAFYDNYGEAIDDGNFITSEVIRVYKQYVNNGGMLPDGKSMSKYPIQLPDGTIQEVNIFAQYNQIPKALPDSVIADMMIGAVPKSNTYTASQVASFVARAENLEPVKNPVYALTSQTLDDLEDVVVVTLPRPYIEQHPNGNKFLTKLEEMSLLNLTKEATPKQQAQGFSRIIKYEPDDTYGVAITTVIDRQDYNKLLANNPNLSKVFIKRTGAIDEDTALKITNARSQLSGNKGQFTSVELQGKNREGQANDNRLAIFNNTDRDSLEANVITRTDKEGNVIGREYLGTPESERWYGEGTKYQDSYGYRDIIGSLLDDTNDSVTIDDNGNLSLLTNYKNSGGKMYRGVDTSQLPNVIKDDIDIMVSYKRHLSTINSKIEQVLFDREAFERGLITPDSYLSTRTDIQLPNGLNDQDKYNYVQSLLNQEYRQLQQHKLDVNSQIRNKYANQYDFDFNIEPATNPNGQVTHLNLSAKLTDNAKARLGNEISNIDNEIVVLENELARINTNYEQLASKRPLVVEAMNRTSYLTNQPAPYSYEGYQSSLATIDNKLSQWDRQRQQLQIKLNGYTIEKANKHKLLTEGTQPKSSRTSTKRLGTQQVGIAMGDEIDKRIKTWEDKLVKIDEKSAELEAKVAKFESMTPEAQKVIDDAYDKLDRQREIVEANIAKLNSDRTSVLDITSKYQDDLDNPEYRTAIESYLKYLPSGKTIDDMVTDRTTGLTARESGISLRPMEYEFDDNDANVLLDSNKEGKTLNYFGYLPTIDTDTDVIKFRQQQATLDDRNPLKGIKIVSTDNNYIYGTYTDYEYKIVPTLDKNTGTPIIDPLTGKQLETKQKIPVTKTVAIKRDKEMFIPATLEGKPYTQGINTGLISGDANVMVNDENLVPFMKYGQRLNDQGELISYASDNIEAVPLFPNREDADIRPWIFEPSNDRTILSLDDYDDTELDLFGGYSDLRQYGNTNSSNTGMSDVLGYESNIDTYNTSPNEVSLSKVQSELLDSEADVVDDFIDVDTIDESYSEPSNMINNMYDISNNYIPYSQNSNQSVIDVLNTLRDKVDNYDTSIAYAQRQLSSLGYNNLEQITQLADTRTPNAIIARNYLDSLTLRNQYATQYEQLSNEYKLFESQYPQSKVIYETKIPATPKYDDAGELIRQKPSLYVQSDGTYSATPKGKYETNPDGTQRFIPSGDNYNLASDLVADLNRFEQEGLAVPRDLYGNPRIDYIDDTTIGFYGAGTLPLDLPFEGQRFAGLQTPDTNWRQFTQEQLAKKDNIDKSTLYLKSLTDDYMGTISRYEDNKDNMTDIQKYKAILDIKEYQRQINNWLFHPDNKDRVNKALNNYRDPDYKLTPSEHNIVRAYLNANVNRFGKDSSITNDALRQYIAQLSNGDINITKQYLTNVINNQVNWFNREAKKARVSSYQELIDKTANNVKLLRDKLDEVDTQLQQAYSIDPNSNQSIKLLKQAEQLDIALKDTIARLERYNAIASNIFNNQIVLNYLTTQTPVQVVDNLSDPRQFSGFTQQLLLPSSGTVSNPIPNNISLERVLVNPNLPPTYNISGVLGNNQQLFNQAPTIPVGYNPQYQTERLLLPPANEADVTLSQVVNPTNQPVITVPVTGQSSNVVIPTSITNKPSNIEAQIGNSSGEQLAQAILNRRNQALNRVVGQPQQVNQSVSSNNNVPVTPPTPQVSQQVNQSVQGNTSIDNTSIPQGNTPSNKVIITDNNGNRQLIDKALLPYLIGGGLTGGLIINDLFNRDDREANIRANL